MKSSKSRDLPVRILKIWFTITLVVGAIASIVGVAWLAISPFVMAGGEVPVDGTVYVTIGQRSVLPVLDLELQPGESAQELGMQTPRLVKGHSNRWVINTRTL